MIFVLVCLIVIAIVSCLVVSQASITSDINISEMTAIVCNYARPHNVRIVVDHLFALGIRDIIIAHGNPNTYEEFENCNNVKISGTTRCTEQLNDILWQSTLCTNTYCYWMMIIFRPKS